MIVYCQVLFRRRWWQECGKARGNMLPTVHEAAAGMDASLHDSKGASNSFGPTADLRLKHGWDAVAMVGHPMI